VYEVCLYKYFCGMTKWCHDACYPPHCRILVAWLALADFQSPSPSTSCTSHVDLRPIRKQILFLRKRVSCRDKELRVSFFFSARTVLLTRYEIDCPVKYTNFIHMRFDVLRRNQHSNDFTYLYNMSPASCRRSKHLTHGDPSTQRRPRDSKPSC
jgi:hypothetical protein